MIRFIILLMILAFFSLSRSTAADITISTNGTDGYPSIKIKGEIIDGDQDKFIIIARKAPNAIVYLDSPGGEVEPAIEIGRIIWFNEMITVVENGECASACGLIWLAGTPRTISENGKVGFHAVYTVSNKNSSSVSSSGNALVGSYLASLKMNNKVIEYITSTSPKSIKWLTEKDSISIGLETFFMDREIKAIDEHNLAVSRIIDSNGKADQKSIQLYMSAARLGFAGSQNNLGDLYESGNGLKQDKVMAVHWYTRSAERGEPTAYLSLASILEPSQDPEILIEALKFAILASNSLPEGSNKNLAIEISRKISDRLPPSYRVIAIDLAKKWIPLYQEDTLLTDDPTN